MVFSFQAPYLHGISRVSAQARVIEGSDRKFAMLTLTFSGQDGQSQSVDAYFDDDASQQAFNIEHAINALASAGERA